MAKDGRTAARTPGQTVLEVRMELLSDAIFGSGFSVPGGEDVAVNQDRQGWPYMKGSTFKGLLRESLENLLVWTGGSETDLNALTGTPGWDNPGDSRRVHLTELTLENKPASPEECYSVRTFTSLEGGVVKTDTLRTASCIRQGLVFIGLLYCQPVDVDLLKQALLGVKWVGTMRSRGFGRVRVTGTAVKKADTSAKSDSAADSETDEQKQDYRSAPPSEGAACIRYRLHTDSPVLATDMARSWGNRWETLHCIPGAAVRGALIRQWIDEHPDEEKGEASGFLRELLSDCVRFSDALPTVQRGADKDDFYVPLPSPIGFYEDKQEEHFHSILRTGEADSDCKAAKLGHFCALDMVEGELKEKNLLCWKVFTDSTLRIQRGNGADSQNGTVPQNEEDDGRQVFETRWLDGGQTFVGSVTLDNPALAERISGLFPETLWLGADRYGGFGRCSVTKLDFGEKPENLERYGMKRQEDVTDTLYLLLLSPTTMRDQNGEPCGLDETALAKQLDVDSVNIQYSAASVSDYSGYNSTWECRVPGARMYDRGSVFKLLCSSPPSLKSIHAVELSGLGLRRAEGYGQVLFLSARTYEALNGKRRITPPVDTIQARTAAAARRARLQWVMRESETIQAAKLSRSQIGDIQALCENAISHGGDWQKVRDYLNHNLTERGALHGDRFTVIAELIHDTMEKSGFLPETMNVTGSVEKLKLLCQLFDFSRKIKADNSKADTSRADTSGKEGQG